MKIGVIGTGYVGLTLGVCLANKGHVVVCVDIDGERIAALQNGRVPIFEPGLDEALVAAKDNISFTTSTEEAVHDADIVFIAVGTPPRDDNKPNLTYLIDAAEAILRGANRSDTIVVVKSTVPPGTTCKVRAAVKLPTIFSPEFLREGTAIDDLLHPDRVVLGADDDLDALSTVFGLYMDMVDTDVPILTMSTRSAEMTKYAANAMLATRIAFINEIGRICNNVNADVRQVARAIGMDKRIGPEFLVPGMGYGGSCFPKDVKALVALADSVCSAIKPLLASIDKSNEIQKKALYYHAAMLGLLNPGDTVAVWGLSFKPNTDDVRESPSFPMIAAMANAGVKVQVYDPQANLCDWNFDRGNDVIECVNKYDALKDASVLFITVAWDEFEDVDIGKMKKGMTDDATILDGRTYPGPSKQLLSTAFNYLPLFYCEEPI